MSKTLSEEFAEKAAELERSARNQQNPLYATVYDRLVVTYRLLAEMEKKKSNETLNKKS